MSLQLVNLQSILPSGILSLRLCAVTFYIYKPIAKVDELAMCNPPDDFIINRTKVHNYCWGGECELWGAVCHDPCNPERRGVPSTCLPLSLSLSSYLSIYLVFTRRKAESCVRSRAPHPKTDVRWERSRRSQVGARQMVRATRVCAFSDSRVIGWLIRCKIRCSRIRKNNPLVGC